MLTLEIQPGMNVESQMKMKMGMMMFLMRLVMKQEL